MDTFQVGEVAVIIGAMTEKDNIGRECVVIGSKCIRTDSEGDTYECYQIEVAGKEGKRFAALPKHLRKPRPPTTTWDDVTEFTGWKPKENETPFLRIPTPGVES